MSVVFALIAAVLAFIITVQKWNEADRKNQSLILCSVLAFLTSLASAAFDAYNRQASGKDMARLREDAANAARDSAEATKLLTTANDRLIEADENQKQQRATIAKLEGDLTQAKEMVANTNKEVENAKAEAKKFADERDKIKRQIDDAKRKVEDLPAILRKEVERFLDRVFAS